MHLEKTDIIFNTFEDWVNTAQYVLGTKEECLKERLICIDEWNAKCTCGADFQRAKKRKSFPVRVYKIIGDDETNNVIITEKDIEKFKELLGKTLDLNVDLTRQCNKRKRDNALIIKILKDLNLNKQELIEMYEELEEQKEKPIIKVIRLKLEKQFRDGKYYIYSVISATTDKNNNLEYVTINYETKENGTLITDDFIFINTGNPKVRE